MAAADAVLVPLQCEFFALEGLSQLMRTIDLVRGSLNPRLEIQGVVLTMYDRRNSLSRAGGRGRAQHFGEKVYETVIPRNVRVSEAPSFRQAGPDLRLDAPAARPTCSSRTSHRARTRTAARVNRTCMGVSVRWTDETLHRH